MLCCSYQQMNIAGKWCPYIQTIGRCLHKLQHDQWKRCVCPAGMGLWKCGGGGGSACCHLTTHHTPHYSVWQALGGSSSSSSSKGISSPYHLSVELGLKLIFGEVTYPMHKDANIRTTWSMLVQEDNIWYYSLVHYTSVSDWVSTARVLIRPARPFPTISPVRGRCILTDITKVRHCPTGEF